MNIITQNMKFNAKNVKKTSQVAQDANISNVAGNSDK